MGHPTLEALRLPGHPVAMRFKPLFAAGLFFASGIAHSLPLGEDLFLSQAREAPRVVRVSAGFHKPEDLALPAPFGARIGAVHRLMPMPPNPFDFYVPPSDRACSGVVISPDGYVLTAAHCFDLAWIQRAELGKISVYRHRNRVQAYGGTRTSMGGERFQELTLEVAGKGYFRSLKDDLSSLSGRPDLIAQLSEVASGDWAIVKITAARRMPCVPADPRPLEEGEALFAVGFPAATKRTGAPGSPGGERRVSTGANAASIRSNAELSDLSPESREVKAAIFQPAIDAGDMILSSVDSFSGQSGGALLDAKGNLVGHVTASDNDEKEYVENGAYGVSVKKVFEDLRSAGMDPTKFFSCPAARP